jgi:putative membrane protein
MRIGKLIINGLALLAAGIIVPPFHLHYGADMGVVYVILLAVAFGVINTFIKPIVKAASLPINLLTLGLFGFVVNAVMLVLLAFVAGLLQSNPYALRLGSFPPDINFETLVAAVAGAIVVSIVSTVLAWFIPDK